MKGVADFLVFTHPVSGKTMDLTALRKLQGSSTHPGAARHPS